MRNLITQFGLDDRLQSANLKRYVLQCTVAGGVVLILLFVLDAITQTVLIAALGASTFIAFALPRSLHSDPRHMIGGYVVGTAAGGLLGTANASLGYADAAGGHSMMIVFGALAIALAMFLMVITKTEHPPAAALALGLVLNEWDLLTLLVVIGGVIALSMIKQLILPLLMDLL